MQDVFVVEGETSRSHEINSKGFHEKLCVSDISGRTPVSVTAQQYTQTKNNLLLKYIVKLHREIASFNTDNEFNRKINEEDIDFNIPGLPHSTVKQLHSASVRELIQKIENHPNRHAFQRNLQQVNHLIFLAMNQTK